MNQIKFTRDIEFNNDGNFFDDHPHESSFYENSYLAINPNLHDEDAPEKIKVTKEAIQYLILRYNFNPRKIKSPVIKVKFKRLIDNHLGWNNGSFGSGGHLF